MDLTTKMIAQIQATASKTSVNATPTTTLDHKVTISLTDGTGASKADQVVELDGSLAASTNLEIDLAGSLTDMFGDTVTFARVKAVLIENDSTEADAVLIVGGAAANDWTGPFQDSTDKIEVRPGGIAMFACIDATAWAVTAGTGDLLKIENESGSNACTYRITIIGEST
jgi:hypothetical protein